MEFLLQAELDVRPFIDDVITLGSSSYYLDDARNPEVLDANPGIRRFVWEHLVVVHRVLHRFEFAGVTISGLKLVIAFPEVLLAGIRCSSQGRSVKMRSYRGLEEA